MKMSRNMLLAALLFVAPCSFITCSEGASNQQNQKPNQDSATPAAQASRSMLLAIPFALTDATARLTDNVLAVPFNVFTSRLFNDTRFQSNVTNINRGLVFLTTLYAAYYLYTKYNANEEENNDDIFGDDFDNVD